MVGADRRRSVGPYLSSAVADGSAISLAKLDFKAGQKARVAVEEDKLRIVYDSELPDPK